MTAYSTVGNRTCQFQFHQGRVVNSGVNTFDTPPLPPQPHPSPTQPSPTPPPSSPPAP